MKRTIEDVVREKYGAVAESELSSNQAGVRAVAEAFGYSPEELASIPADANMGLSCGNPTATASLRPGEVVVDLGSGGGLDVFLAAAKVGPTGKAIGIDMTPAMIDRARQNAAKQGITNVEFHLSTIDRIPLPDASVDCILSNCVINLASDKPAVFREMLRVLKPGGRIAISDIALRQPLPEEVAKDVQAYVGCVAGAILIADYERMLREAGFDAVVVSDTGADLNAYAKAAGGCCTASACCDTSTAAASDESLHEGLARLMKDFNANDFAASVRVHAVKSHSATSNSDFERRNAMKSVEVFDKPMCCSTGVCGPQVNPVLPRFAADLAWLKTQGVQVERFNLAQQPTAFIQNKAVHELLATEGTDCLPLILVDGRVVGRRGYPTREMLTLWTGAGRTQDPIPDAKPAGVCCTGSNCC